MTDIVPALVDTRATATPDAPALLVDDGAIAFAALAERSRRVAGGLAALGIGAGDRVALWLPNLPAWLELYLALARLGAVAVSVNTRFRAVELADIVGRSGARALAVAPGFAPMDVAATLDAVDPAALQRVRHIIAVGDEPLRPPARARLVRHAALAAASSLARENERATPEAGTAIFTTSGTTSLPKFVLHRQAAIAGHARAVAPAFGYDAPDAVMFQGLPYAGVFGFCQAMAALAAGRPSVVPPVFAAESAALAIVRHRATHTNGSDEMYRRLLEAAPGAHPFASLRRAGFAAFNGDPAELVDAAEARGLRLSGLYGMSEVQALYAARAPDAPAEQRRLAGGRPVSPAARFRVRDPESGALLGPGAAGELELAGPSLMAGYAEDEAATARAMTDDGFVRTGDLGYLDPDGRGFVFVSRLGDTLRLGGYLVNPDEIAAALERHPDVSGAQVVGVPGPRGQRAVAFVVARPGTSVDAAALQEFCRRGLAGFKVPAAIWPIDAFPMAESANGAKIQRARLRALAAERFGGAAERFGNAAERVGGGETPSGAPVGKSLP
jgi:fatty-acyl-CoA synthase